MRVFTRHPVFLLFAFSIFISADSHADLERNGEFHSSSLMIDELIGHTAKDGRCSDRVILLEQSQSASHTPASQHGVCAGAT